MKIRYALIALVMASAVEAQIPRRPAAAAIPSLTEPGEGLAVRSVSRQTGLVTFANGRRGILLPLEGNTPAAERAAKFVDLYGAPFGLQHSSQVRLLRAPFTDDAGMEHVRWQQVHQGVPVRGAELLVHLRGPRVMAANGRTVRELPNSITPTIAADAAREVARQLIAKHRPDAAPGAAYSEPRLEILNRSLLEDGGDPRSRLAWFVEVTGPMLRQFVWIDAHSRAILLQFSQLAEAKSRRIHNSAHTSTLPGALMRNEGGATTGDADADAAYTLSGVTYDYFLNNHGRDSYNNAGAMMISSVHYCASGYPQGSTCPDYQNAAWNGTQMLYADGYASADDVVGHELTHAVTEYSANLFYYSQSGALNESFSDIFGETIDLLDGTGDDSAGARWQLGEDLPNGAIRHMMNPTLYGDPGKMSDAEFWCSRGGWTDPYGDSDGVHINSGIPNHAYALMADGGTYNSTTIAGIGLTKAAKIQYRALTTYLTSGARFIDNFDALNQSCTDLIGTAGITAANCTQVTNALLAVEMNNTWGCVDAAQPPPLCSAGSVANTFLDTFENGGSNWTTSGLWHSLSTGYAKSGLYMAYGEDVEDILDSTMRMTSPVVIPAGARLYFDHAFEFESDGFVSPYDGGVLEYSINGTTWFDAGFLIDAGQSYNGFLDSTWGNPLGGRSAFTFATHGYTGTRLNLAPLAGQSVRFRLRIGSDNAFGSLGWVVDNFRIYTCSAVTTGNIHVDDAAGVLGTVNVGTESSATIGHSGAILTDIARTSSGAMYGIDLNNLYSINTSTGAATLIGSLGAGGGGMNALVASGSGLLAASNSSTSIYSINTSTGAATPLSGSLGFSSMGDLAFHRGSLYAAVMNGTFSDLVRVTISGSSFTATNLGHVTSENDLYGLAKGSDNNLYGFAGTRVLKINTTNPALSTIVVPNFGAGSTLGQANGATSAAPAPFTDDPLVAGTTRIKAAHINELRTRINAARAAYGLAAFTFTDTPLASGGRIKGVHVTNLRTALSEVYTAIGLSTPSFTDATLTTSIKVKALHIAEIRNALIALE
jgi:bacillolysin